MKVEFRTDELTRPEPEQTLEDIRELLYILVKSGGPRTSELKSFEQRRLKVWQVDP